ncbi:MAG: response regulator [Rhodospirillales bacterium]|nr:response regulator [Rhodospirillales bacterium]
MRSTPFRIGIIDDDAPVREALGDLVEAFGYQPFLFASACTLLNDAMLTQLRCLIVDVHMPRMDGITLQHHLIAWGIWTPIIFITSDTNAALRARALAAGACGFLGKPFRSEELQLCLDTIIERAV